MTPRNVLHVVTALGIGGTETQLLELLRRHRGSRWRPLLVTLRPPEALEEEIERLAIHPTCLALGGSLASPATLRAIGSLALWIRRHDVSVVHCHDVYGALVGVPAAWLARVPVVTARRDLGHHLGPVQRVALRAALRMSTRVLVNASCVARHIERVDHVPKTKVVVVPNGIDLDRFDQCREKWQAAPPEGLGEGPTVVTVANMGYEAKGHDDLIAAAALVGQHAPAVRILMVGDGQREPYLRGLACKYGVAGRACFVGRRADVPAILARADVVCHPARSEGLPNAVLEAMAAARPIVATTAGGTGELIEHGVHGLLVEPGNPPALAAAILDLIADQERGRRLGASARLRVERRFSARKLGQRVATVYDQLFATAREQQTGK